MYFEGKKLKESLKEKGMVNKETKIQRERETWEGYREGRREE